MSVSPLPLPAPSGTPPLALTPRWPGIELLRPPLQPTARTSVAWVSAPDHGLPAALGCDVVALLVQESYRVDTPPLPLLALRLLPDASASLWCYLPLDEVCDLGDLSAERLTALVLAALRAGWALAALAAPPRDRAHPALPGDELLRVWTGLRLSPPARTLLDTLVLPQHLAPVLCRVATDALRGPVAASTPPAC